jgi:negative regulator of sigma E activity
MAEEHSLSDILDDCISRVAQGESVEACLADYPVYSDELRGDLDAAFAFHAASVFRPRTDAKRAARLRMFDAIERKQHHRVWLGNPIRRSWFATGTRIAATAAVALVALVTSGTGTVWAAQSSSPGDLLYPVKRTGEQVQLAFAFSSSREADLRDSLLARRVEELGVVTAAGRERFVPDLVEEIIEHSARAQELATAPVREIVATLPEIDAQPTILPANMAGATVIPGSITAPAITPRPSSRANKQVSATPVLALSGVLDRIDERLEALASDVLEESSRKELARLRKTLNQTRSQLDRLMNRADQVHNPDVVERAVDRDVEPNPEDIKPTATPEPAEPLTLNLEGRVTGRIQEVVFQQENGKLSRVDVLVTLDDGGSLLKVQFMEGGTRLLMDGKGASVKSLRPSQQVVISVEGGTGEVLAMSIFATNSQSDANDDKVRIPSSVTPQRETTSQRPAIASSQRKPSRAAPAK